MRRIDLRVLGCVVFLLTAAGTARAREAFNAAALAKQIEPFVSDKTVLVIHASADRTDLDADKNMLIKWAGIAVGKVPTAAELQSLDREMQPAKELLAEFTKAGGLGVFVVINVGDLPADPGFAVIPLANGADAEAIKKVVEERFLSKLPKGPDSPVYVVEKLGNLIFAGSDKSLRRAKMHLEAPVARPELAPAFEAAGDSEVQYLLVPQSEPRNLAAGLLPQLPPQLGGGPTTVVTTGLSWAAIGISIAPAGNLKIVLQAKDADAAQSLQGIVNKGFGMAQNGPGGARQKAVGEVLKSLTPVVKGDRLTASMDEAQLEELLKKVGVTAKEAPVP